jgi:membrane peptidoglycan carboxypeptidase
VFYTKVIDHDNNVILENTLEANSRTVIKPSTAYVLTDIMEGVITGGTGGKARFTEIQMPISGKTGTSTNESNRTNDLTFVGFTPYYTAGIWLGHDIEQYITEDAGHHMLIWSHIMQEVHRNLEYKDFERPAGIISATVCKDSGKLAVSGLCDADTRGSRSVSDIFPAGNEPNDHCDIHTSIEIDTLTGMRATASTPADRRRTIIGVAIADEEITGNDFEIPQSMIDGDPNTRLNENYTGEDPIGEGGYEYITDPETNELIRVPIGSGIQNPTDIPTISRPADIPANNNGFVPFNTAPRATPDNQGVTNTPPPVIPQMTPPPSTPTPNFETIPGGQGDANQSEPTDVDVITGEPPSSDRPPGID